MQENNRTVTGTVAIMRDNLDVFHCMFIAGGSGPAAGVQLTRERAEQFVAECNAGITWDEERR